MGDAEVYISASICGEWFEVGAVADIPLVDYGREKRHSLNAYVSSERVDMSEEEFYTADFDVRMKARVFVSIMGKVCKVMYT